MDRARAIAFWECFLKNPEQYLRHIFDRKSFISAMITAFYVCPDDLLLRLAKADLDVSIPPSNGQYSGLIKTSTYRIEVSESTGEFMFYSCNRRVRKGNGVGAMSFVQRYFTTTVKSICYVFSPAQFKNSTRYLENVGIVKTGAKGLIYSSTNNSCYMDSLFMTLIYMKNNNVFTKQLFSGKVTADSNSLQNIFPNKSETENKVWVKDLTNLLYMLYTLTIPSAIPQYPEDDLIVTIPQILVNYFGSVDYNNVNVKLALRVLRPSFLKLPTKPTSYTKFTDLRDISTKFLDIFPNMATRITSGRHKGKLRWNPFSIDDIYSKLTDIYPGLKLTYKFRDISDETPERNFVYKEWEKDLWQSYSVNYEHYFKDQIAFVTHPPFIVFSLLTPTSNKFLVDNGFRWKLTVNTVNYDLQGIIVYTGDHYYAYIKTLYFGWIRSDSAQMSLVDLNEIEEYGKSRATLLFYCKV